jgi:hypothetical protein
MRARGSRDAIEVACPRCGCQTATRISRLDQARTCTACGVSFSINECGRYVVEQSFASTWLGRRLTAIGKQLRLDSALKAVKSRTAGTRAVVSRRWLHFPPALRWLISIGGGICLAVVAASLLFSFWTTGNDAPREHAESLHMRAEMACQALLLGDDAVLSGLTTRDTHDEARQWMSRVRPKTWPRSSELAKTAQVELRTLFKSLKTQRAAVYYEIHTIAHRSSDGDAEVEGALCWTLGHDGRWQLDGRRTLAELSIARSTD